MASWVGRDRFRLGRLLVGVGSECEETGVRIGMDRGACVGVGGIASTDYM